jgi:hypothetical protein
MPTCTKRKRRSAVFTKSLSSAIRRASCTLLVALPMLANVAAVSAQDSNATPMPIASVSAEEAISTLTAEDGMLRFDVAEDMTKFAFDPDLTHDDGMPAYGATFITSGYIYPAGTLDGSNGVNADGSPEFPDKVLGQWVCRGWFVGEGARTTTGAMVITSQIYNFGDGLGQATLTSDGYELADVGMEIERAITGGTGPFAGAGGVARQTFLGFNASEGVSLQYELDIESGDS